MNHFLLLKVLFEVFDASFDFKGVEKISDEFHEMNEWEDEMNDDLRLIEQSNKMIKKHPKLTPALDKIIATGFYDEDPVAALIEVFRGWDEIQAALYVLSGNRNTVVNSCHNGEYNGAVTLVHSRGENPYGLLVIEDGKYIIQGQKGIVLKTYNNVFDMVFEGYYKEAT